MQVETYLNDCYNEVSTHLRIYIISTGNIFIYETNYILQLHHIDKVIKTMNQKIPSCARSTSARGKEPYFKLILPCGEGEHVLTSTIDLCLFLIKYKDFIKQFEEAQLSNQTELLATSSFKEMKDDFLRVQLSVSAYIDVKHAVDRVPMLDQGTCYFRTLFAFFSNARSDINEEDNGTNYLEWMECIYKCVSNTNNAGESRIYILLYGIG